MRKQKGLLMQAANDNYDYNHEITYVIKDTCEESMLATLKLCDEVDHFDLCHCYNSLDKVFSHFRKDKRVEEGYSFSFEVESGARIVLTFYDQATTCDAVHPNGDNLKLVTKAEARRKCIGGLYGYYTAQCSLEYGIGPALPLDFKLYMINLRPGCRFAFPNGNVYVCKSNDMARGKITLTKGHSTIRINSLRDRDLLDLYRFNKDPETDAITVETLYSPPEEKQPEQTGVDFEKEIALLLAGRKSPIT